MTFSYIAVFLQLLHYNSVHASKNQKQTKLNGKSLYTFKKVTDFH